VFLHGYRYVRHERAAEDIARQIGFHAKSRCRTA